MLLQRLVELQRTREGAIEMYQPTRVAWKIQLDLDGKLRGITPLTGEGKKAERGQEMMAPTVVRSVGVAPKLLCDNGEYVLGIPRGEDSNQKVPKRHAAFKALSDACAVATGDPYVRAVAQFLASWNPTQRALVPPNLDAGSVMTFEVEGVLPIELPAVQRYWASHTRPSDEQAIERTTCLVCGTSKPPEASHPKKIKGVPGAQTSGAAMISANRDAFESYGLEKSLTSPTCRECAEAFADSLNYLLASPENRLYLGPAVYVYWTRGAPSTDLLGLLNDPSPDDVKALLTSPGSGRDVADLIATPQFYLVSLSGSGGRVVVRDYLETSVPRVRENVARWFRLQRLEPDRGAIGLYPLAMGLVHEDLDEVSPSLLASLVRVAITGGRVSEGFLQLLARRNRAEGGPTRPRAALARMVIASNPNTGYTEDRLMALETENNDPAYLCGRLFAELAAAQRAALGDTGTTIVDRFYGTASSAPATVFGPLLRGGQAHLAKLRQSKPGAHVAIEGRIQSIAAAIPAFPSTLDLRSQALFSLGYYHQKESNAAQARERAAAKRGEASQTGDGNND